MELVAVPIPGGTQEEVLDNLVAEYLSIGWSPTQIMFLFQSPQYVATHQIYLSLGKDHVKEKIHQLAGQWSRGWLDQTNGTAPKEGDRNASSL